MKMVMAVMTGALGLALASCAGMPGTMDDLDHPSGPDGAWCGTPGVSGPVYIEIRYAGDGTPSAVPEQCTVAPKTQITWRGPGGDLIPFEIVFPGASPVWRDERPKLVSGEDGGRYKVKIQASDQKGTYKYGIKAGGKEIDPAIIIR